MSEPLLLSTWHFGQKANEAGWPYLVGASSNCVDAIEHACRAVEADPDVQSVGFGGLPDATGTVTLDAAIMTAPDSCGAVCALEGIKHPISIARVVMERSSHVMLAGKGAAHLARRHGFHQDLLITERSHRRWLDWLVTQQARQQELGKNYLDEQCHDTIAVIARDKAGRIAAGCSTSGLAFKAPGRVGDSPIIGHGLYVDPEVGAAVATGTGELIMRVCGSFLAVELMRRGYEPVEAGRQVLQRVAQWGGDWPTGQAAFIILSASGSWAAVALRDGFHVAVRTRNTNELRKPDFVLFS